MAQLNKLERRYLDLTHEILNLLVSGRACLTVNKDVIEYKPGTVEKVNELLSRRKEISNLLDEQSKD